ncbi:hypothetical protein ACH5RR_010855 [Cinchona calisaya]|uniref:CP12 domain-containing protein n=1 Tax=Cinchona calisaya TaxID=153742 RepID=A0ABD3AK59_9GENT
MATTAGLRLSSTQILAKASDCSKIQTLKLNNDNIPFPWKRSTKLVSSRRVYVQPVAAVPEKLSDKVAESVKNAEEACASDPESGECAAAWDEVEELSAAASHARDREKESDVLENYCKENPETDECRTYDN